MIRLNKGIERMRNRILNSSRSLLWAAMSMILICTAFVNVSNGQVAWTDRRWIRVGSYQHFYEAWGAEYSYNGSYYEGMRWPSQFSYTDNFVTKRPLWAAQDFTDVTGANFATVGLGLSRGKDLQVATPVELTQIAKFQAPEIYVDGVNTTEIYSSDVDSINPDIKPDRILINKINTFLGVTLTRRILAFSQQYHDNYHIIEYTFTNTGNIDGDPDIELPDQNITNFYAGEFLHYATSREAAQTVDGSQSWGNAQWVTKRGETYGMPNQQPEDSLRAFFSWMGLHDRVSWDNIGGPDLEGNGRLSSPQFIGEVFLHVDKSATDSTDDPRQPGTIGWNGNDTYPKVSDIHTNTEYVKNLRFLQGQMLNGDTTRMYEANRENQKYPVRLTDPGGAATIYSVGPFNLDFGQSVTFVRAEGVNGLSRDKCEEIGAKYLESYQNPDAEYSFELPDGSTISGSYNDNQTVGDKTPDIFKDAWVMTGMDSVLKTFGRAARNYAENYNIPQPPRPPATFLVESGGDRIHLEWTNESEQGIDDFGGYRIYRALGRPDTTFEEIFACGIGTANPQIVHEFDDTTPQRGFSYYYYIVAFDDGSENDTPANPGGSLHSNPEYTITTEPARLKRQAGSSLASIRVVPNPYNIRAGGARPENIQYYNQDQIMFLDIPGQCRIKIFSERGDLINTINHTDGSGDQEWLLTSSSRQVIVSGVYIAHFEVMADQRDPETDEILYRKGETAIRKFVVIR